jgi:hypothetical protein
MHVRVSSSLPSPLKPVLFVFALLNISILICRSFLWEEGQGSIVAMDMLVMRVLLHMCILVERASPHGVITYCSFNLLYTILRAP